MRIVPINNGYYNYKSINGELLRSSVKEIKMGQMVGMETLELDEKCYVVGIGDSTLKMDKTVNNNTKVLILSMLCRILSREGKNSDEVILFLSAPPKSYHHQKEALKNYLVGDYEVKYKENPYMIKIKDVVTFPETFISFLPNNVGGFYDNKILIIVDIGGFTTNICKIEFGKFGEDDYISYENGMHHLNESMATLLNTKHPDKLDVKGEDMRYFKLNGLVKDGVDYIKAERKEIDEKIKEFIDEIERRTILKKWDIDTYEMLVMGGGGKDLFEYINKRYPKARLGSDPLFDNLNALKILAEQVKL